MRAATAFVPFKRGQRRGPPHTGQTATAGPEQRFKTGASVRGYPTPHRGVLSTSRPGAALWWNCSAISSDFMARS
ncbi:MAG: hypothetical protein E6614_26985, partial [Bradyrhizobium sp.]|nr:hypothetical protein [Bradyrhizobium sp.]